MNTSVLLPDHVTMVAQAPPSVVGIANTLTCTVTGVLKSFVNVTSAIVM